MQCQSKVFWLQLDMFKNKKLLIAVNSLFNIKYLNGDKTSWKIVIAKTKMKLKIEVIPKCKQYQKTKKFQFLFPSQENDFYKKENNI